MLDLEYDDPYMNLAVEEAIPRKVGEGIVPSTIRFWRNLNAVVIGYHQCAKLEVNFEACRKQGTTIVRRFTGGGAVYHDHGNLNYAISLLRSHRLVQNDIFKTIKSLSQGVIEGLKILGINAEPKSINTIQVNGRKISGTAESIRWGTIFYHGSLLVSSDLGILSRLLNFSGEKPEGEDSRYIRSLRIATTTIANELRSDVSMMQVKEALIRGFEKTYTVKLASRKLTEEEKETAQELCEKKYSTNKWNFRRK